MSKNQGVPQTKPGSLSGVGEYSGPPCLLASVVWPPGQPLCWSQGVCGPLDALWGSMIS